MLIRRRNFCDGLVIPSTLFRDQPRPHELLLKHGLPNLGAYNAAPNAQHSWGNDMFWGVYQAARSERAANAANARAGQAQSKASSTAARLIRLEHRVEGLALACQSLWEIASEKMEIDQATLLAKMEEVDLRDGKLDGRMRRHSQKCPECDRVSRRDRKNCLYCGHELAGDGHSFGV